MTTHSKILCTRCAGSGLLRSTDPSGAECWVCRGTGWVKPETQKRLAPDTDRARMKCESCGGSGLVDPKNPSGRKCRACRGTGWARRAKEKMTPASPLQAKAKCETCNGSGLADSKNPSGPACPDGHGSGWTEAGDQTAALAPVDVEVVIPDPGLSRLREIFHVIDVHRESQQWRHLPMVQRPSRNQLKKNIAIAVVALAFTALLIATIMHG